MFIGYFSFYYNKVNIKYRQKSPLERVSLDLSYQFSNYSCKTNAKN